MHRIFEPSKEISWMPWRMASFRVRICCAITERTSRSIRLNSSKQAHAPQLDSLHEFQVKHSFLVNSMHVHHQDDKYTYPLKNLAMAR